MRYGENEASPASQRSRLEFHINEYGYQKPGKDQGQIETEIIHCIGYKISGDLEERGSRGEGEKPKPVTTEITISAR